ncbi:DUF6114 domain-containing protein [Heyndrickxia coagulans]|uniref:Uncharacterized protein n=1 Tax=Heyndrickxia coagulans DSM 1 = ATCC 7050 TaxID=1121088 RepID=A0A8B4BUX3_HEYCO|nr:DUF6114 domain-containing protein [Heyndrickxia coagulans]AJH77713.1 hypothetical protein BF29_1582 [Heyndrickxia coagulans DSM 1 = ATCC 7050]MCR2846604.1 hypothetical protein [Heyndrickxia coagulans]MDR4224315.1 hypothetical protein [Heyndrickxia coagulans DSM 1 = ATCC 7050]MEC5268319.1 DUF6114 domain-containing protein [Heyndrickxia coagulans]MED4493910.1 DUF6114 domain-containing protein [Heyndrickxia coagulans]
MGKFHMFRMNFRNWRRSRPFWGATFTLLSGMIILYVPVQLLEIAAAPGSMVSIGLIFGGLIFLIGGMGYFFPKFNMVFGILAIFLSVLSIMGAMGGFFIGTLLGIIGGSLSVSWRVIRQEEVPASVGTMEEIAAGSAEER